MSTLLVPSPSCDIITDHDALLSGASQDMYQNLPVLVRFETILELPEPPAFHADGIVMSHPLSRQKKKEKEKMERLQLLM